MAKPTPTEQAQHAAILIIAASSEDLEKAAHTFAALLRTMYKEDEVKLTQVQNDTLRITDALAQTIRTSHAPRASTILACITIAKELLKETAEDILNKEEAKDAGTTTHN